MSRSPDISVLVPVYNEAAELPALLASLAAQRGVVLELVIADGGSTDGTLRLAAEAAGFPFPVRLVAGDKGRGRQLNAAASCACADLLLFLHADSRFRNDDALQRGVSELRTLTRADEGCAGRFRLRFRRSAGGRGWLYHFWEAKARLGRRECIHGDQGFLVPRSLFARLGGFREGLSVAEDTLFAERLRGVAQWCLLTPEISTSARRFETEGLLRRQFANALILAALALGRDGFMRRVGGLYVTDAQGRLRVRPILDACARYMEALSAVERAALWQSLAQYVLSHDWQAPFLLDCWREYRSGCDPGAQEPRFVPVFERRVSPLLATARARKCAALLLPWLFAAVRAASRLEDVAFSGIGRRR